MMSQSLKDVTRAVYLPRKRLGMTLLFGLVIVYLFATIAFYAFPESMQDEYGSEECEQMLTCLAAFLHNGMLSGGGVGDYSSFELGHGVISPNVDIIRFFFNLSFFFVIIVLLLNIIFGIIIDTFGNLRDTQNEKAQIQRSRCFICGIEKDEFDNKYASQGRTQLEGPGFNHHYKHEHNQWDYMYYTMYLHSMDQNCMNGHEKYVWDKMKKKDVTWVPANMALGLQKLPAVEEWSQGVDNTGAIFQDSAQALAPRRDDEEVLRVADVQEDMGTVRLNQDEQGREVKKLADKVDRLMQLIEALPSSTAGARETPVDGGVAAYSSPPAWSIVVSGWAVEDDVAEGTVGSRATVYAVKASYEGDHVETYHRYRDFRGLHTSLLAVLKQRASSSGEQALLALKSFNFPLEGVGTRMVGKSNKMLRKATIEQWCTVVCGLPAVVSEPEFRAFFGHEDDK